MVDVSLDHVAKMLREIHEGPPIAKLTLENLRAMTDDTLLALLNREKNAGGLIPLSLQQTINAELVRRAIKQASKPHWSVTPNFWMGVVTVLSSVIAAVAAVWVLLK